MIRSLRVRLVILGLGCAFVLTTLWYWTQTIASRLGYQKALGQSLDLLGFHVYTPWAWPDWASRFYKRAPGIFDPAIEASGYIFVALGFALAVLLRPPRKASGAHGTARFAEKRELKAAKLLDDRGIVLCQTYDAKLRRQPEGGYRMSRLGALLTDDSDQHAIVVAPTGSGKGESAARPTCYMTKRSLVAIDIKGELFDKTAGYRRQFSHCLRFAPCSKDTVRINPLLNVRKGDKEVADVQNIADILVDPSGTKPDRSHWEKSAAELLVGTMLHVLYAEESKTLARVRQILTDPARPVVETLEIMLKTNHLGDQPHPEVARCARAMLNLADKEQSSVISSARACLALFADPVINAATAENDFQIEDLMSSDFPVSLYMVIPPSDLSRLAPLLRLLLQQMARRLVESLTKRKHKLLFLLDEFPALGRLDFFESALAFFRGYGIKLMPIIQSLNQLAKIYGERNSILDNCNTRLFFAANDNYTARQVSDMLGQATELKKTRGRRFGRGASRSESEQEHARPLLTVGEVIQLPDDEAILFIGGMPPYRAKKVIAYADPRFRDLDRIPAPASAKEQAKELPPPRGHDWLSVKCKKWSPPPKPAPAAAGGGGPLSGMMVLNIPQMGGTARPTPSNDGGVSGQTVPAGGATTADGAWVADSVDAGDLLAQFKLNPSDAESADAASEDVAADDADADTGPDAA
jgi:type IV secretion system protein VirD4